MSTRELGCCPHWWDGSGDLVVWQLERGQEAMSGQIGPPVGRKTDPQSFFLSGHPQPTTTGTRSFISSDQESMLKNCVNEKLGCQGSDKVVENLRSDKLSKIWDLTTETNRAVKSIGPKAGGPCLLFTKTQNTSSDSFVVFYLVSRICLAVSAKSSKNIFYISFQTRVMWIFVL